MGQNPGTQTVPEMEMTDFDPSHYDGNIVKKGKHSFLVIPLAIEKITRW
jgi:hypothetical protein